LSILVAARQELARRAEIELARRSLYYFVRLAWHIVEPESPFKDNWHIKAICDHLEAVYDGRISNLLINVPPGTMKSYLVCVFWPTWVWTKTPAKRFMFSSYAEDLSMRDSLRTKQILESEWYQSRWPLLFSESQNSKGKFENMSGGWRMIGSITGKGTGEHPDFNCVDDPHNVLKAESDQDRQTATRWFEGVFSTRGVVRGVRRVMVMQRLHAQDCSGVALGKKGWTHICLPMRFEAPEKVIRDGLEVLVPRMYPTPIGWQDPRTQDGELLWPEVYSEEIVQTMEVNLGAYGAAGQLQQRPSPRGGGMFQRTWFPIISDLPKLVKVVRYWDKAGTEGGTGAQSAGVAIGKYLDEKELLPARREKFIVLDVEVCRKRAAEREQLIKQIGQLDASRFGYVETWVEQEPGSGGKESAENTVANMAGFTCKIERVTGSKAIRAEPLSSQASVGKVCLLAGQWNAAYLDEIEMFPMGKLKDMVDGTSGAFNKLFTNPGLTSASQIPTDPAPDEQQPVEDQSFGTL
jgi:phage terminase large subunit-like protein